MHVVHHGESMQLLDGLAQRLVDGGRKHSSTVLAEVAQCLLVDMLEEDRYCFSEAAIGHHAVAATPPPPAVNAFGLLVDLLNEHHERIAQARDYYLTLLDDFPTPVCRANADGRFDWFNRTWLSFTGMTAAQANDHGWLATLHPDEHGAFLSTWQRSFAARVPFTAEYRLTDASGAWCWMHHIGHPFFDSDGCFLGYICTLFDITERRQAEASLRVSAVVFEHASEAIMITDGAGRIEAVNPAFAKITGFTNEEIIGHPASLLRSGFHDEAFYAEMWQAVIGRDGWQGEIINRRKGGEIFPAWLSITTIRNAAGELVRMVGVFNDIASSRASQQRLTHLAHHDALTELPNRLLFGARAQHSIERCHRESTHLAVLFIDLDRFKPVNDLLGHKIGDRVLRDVAARLRDALRTEDTVAATPAITPPSKSPALKRGEIS
jgi:PAS domain S-box-containing protein